MKKCKVSKLILSLFLVFSMVMSTVMPSYAVEISESESVIESENTTETEVMEEVIETDITETDITETDITETETTETESTVTESEDLETEEVSESELEETEVETEVEVRTNRAGIQGDELIVYYGVDSGDFQDVDSFAGNQVEFPLVGQTKQIKVFARFGTQEESANRTLEIKIPEGYKILEYAAKDDTPEVDGVSKCNLPAKYQDEIVDVQITDLAGGDFTTQKISGYTAEKSSQEVDVRTYAGKVFYTFEPTVDFVEVTLILGVQQELLPHNAPSYVMDPVDVVMKNGSRVSDKSFTANVTDLMVPIQRSDKVSAEVDTATGKANFNTVITFNAHHDIAGSQSHLAEELEITIPYPNGLSFKGFKDSFLGLGEIRQENYSNNHLTVVNNQGANTVTFTYKNITAYHEHINFLELYWEADIDELDEVTDQWDGSDIHLVIPVKVKETAGGNVASTVNYHENEFNMNVILKWPHFDIELTPRNYVRHDLGMDFPYDYALGGIGIKCIGTGKSETLTYEWEFDENLMIRAVSIPGLTGNDVIGATAKVRKPDGSIVTKTGGAIAVVNTNRHLGGAKITAEYLGLLEGETILELTVTQKELSANDYASNRTRTGGVYYGHFKNGQVGDVKLTIRGRDGAVMASAVDTPSIGWKNSGAGSVKTTAAKRTPDGAISLYPGERIHFTSKYSAGDTMTDIAQNDIVDPTIIISLPKGIELDICSVTAVSKAGNHGNSEFLLDLKSLETINHNGILWKTYRYSSRDINDMIANADNMGGAGVISKIIDVKFSARVSPGSSAYGGVALGDMVQWDLGQTAVNASGGLIIRDEAERAQRGPGYDLATDLISGNLYVVLKKGLNINLSTRMSEDVEDFCFYDGNSSTIAPLKAGGVAEIYLEYLNAGTSDYCAGTEIYVPIPKEDLVYSNFFNNIASDPTNPIETNHKTPEFNMSLTGPVNLDGFTTYYTTDTTGATNEPSEENGWVPVNYKWNTQVADYGKVTMIKFVSNGKIPPVDNEKTKGIGSVTFDVQVDDRAALAEQNFWRSYQKGWSNASGSGDWMYGTVIAAETVKE